MACLEAEASNSLPGRDDAPLPLPFIVTVDGAPVESRHEEVGEGEVRVEAITKHRSPTPGGIRPREAHPCGAWGDPRGEA